MNRRKLLLALLAFTCVLAARAASAQPNVVVERDVVYGNGGGVPLRLDIYRPAAPSGLVPAVLWIHGGGWRNGDKRDHDRPDLESLAERGYFVTSINYRPSTVAQFPAAVEDCKCAVRWVRAHAREYGIDPGRIGAWGFSSGAHLALMLAYTPPAAGLEGSGGNPDASSEIEAVCSFAGPTDFSKGHKQFEGGSGLAELALFGGTLDEKPDLYQEASPLHYVTKAAPPTLMAHGDKDELVPYSQSEALFNKLKASGGDAMLIRVNGGTHFLQQTTSYPELVKAAFDFFDKHLKTSPSTASR